MEPTLFNYPYWVEGRQEIEQCVGRPLQLEDVPEIILGSEQELLLYGTTRMRRVEASAENRRLAFDRMVEMIPGQKEDGRAHQASKM